VEVANEDATSQSVAKYGDQRSVPREESRGCLLRVLFVDNPEANECLPRSGDAGEEDQPAPFFDLCI
jgi:hypothetical protein